MAVLFDVRADGGEDADVAVPDVGQWFGHVVPHAVVVVVGSVEPPADDSPLMPSTVLPCAAYVIERRRPTRCVPVPRSTWRGWPAWIGRGRGASLEENSAALEAYEKPAVLEVDLSKPPAGNDHGAYPRRM